MSTIYPSYSVHVDSASDIKIVPQSSCTVIRFGEYLTIHVGGVASDDTPTDRLVCAASIGNAIAAQAERLINEIGEQEIHEADLAAEVIRCGGPEAFGERADAITEQQTAEAEAREFNGEAA